MWKKANMKKALNPVGSLSFLFRTLRQARFQHERKNMVSVLTGCQKDSIDALVKEVSLGSTFIRSLEEKYGIRKFSMGDFELNQKGGTMFFNCVTLYLLVALFQPDRVVETGGTPGKTSSFILKAMADNDCGHLFTLDLPPKESEKDLGDYRNDFPWHSERPKGMGAGWIVPDNLKKRQTLILGSTRDTLKPLLERLGTIDVFYHDSDHSYENMKFEFETAFPFIREGGILISDDIYHNPAFDELVGKKNCFCKKMPYIGIAMKIWQT
jgi:hypothetical protein